MSLPKYLPGTRYLLQEKNTSPVMMGIGERNRLPAIFDETVPSAIAFLGEDDLPYNFPPPTLPSIYNLLTKSKSQRANVRDLSKKRRLFLPEKTFPPPDLLAGTDVTSDFPRHFSTKGMLRVHSRKTNAKRYKAAPWNRRDDTHRFQFFTTIRHTRRKRVHLSA